MDLKHSFPVALLCAALAGCGGGGDGAYQPPTTAINDPSASAGLWKGTTGDHRQVYGALLGTGAYWVAYSAADNPGTIAGAVEGTATSINGVLYSTDALDFDLQAGVVPATVSVNYLPRNVISGNVNFAGNATSLTAYYLAAAPADLAQVAGTYQGSAAIVGGGESVYLTVGPSGVISGAGSSGCRFSGLAAPRADVPVFDISVTFGGAPCAMGNGSVSGIAFYDQPSNTLIGAALTPGRTNGFLLTAAKQ